MTIYNDYAQLIPFFLLPFVISFVLTPLMGRLANVVGALDLPASLRSTRTATNNIRVHDQIVPRLGGLAMFIAFMFTLAHFNLISSLNWTFILAIVMIAAVGFLDDIYELSGKTQIIVHLLAATIVVLSGTHINLIQVAGFCVDFTNSSALPTCVDLNPIHFQMFTLGGLGFSFFLIGDILTILWIVGLINVVNWVGGTDGLNISVSAISSLALLLVAMRTREDAVIIPIVAYLCVVHLGSILGMLPFNYPPARIYQGGISEYLNGFLLATIAIMNESKLAFSLIVLALPILDAMWVVYMRWKNNPEVRRNPLKILSISDRNHFHHRLVDAGFSRKQVLFIEVGITSMFASIAFFFSDFSNVFVILVFSLGLLLLIFVWLARRRKSYQAKRMLQMQQAPKLEVKVKPKENKPEDRYAY